jgi:hypothetical protein
MLIQLTDTDLEQMPSPLSVALLQWLQSKQIKICQQNSSLHEPASMPQQLNLKVDVPISKSKSSQQQAFVKASQSTHIRVSQQVSSKNLCEHSHVRIAQLFDMGLLSEKTQIRIRLKQDRAKLTGYSYVTNAQISLRGTVIYEGEEFDKPSPLATKVNGGSVNGWEYVEVKRNGQWICLNELRQVWRNAS